MKNIKNGFWKISCCSVLLLLASQAFSPPSANAEGNTRGGGGGTSRHEIMQDSYYRRNTLKRSEDVMQKCVLPAVASMKKRLPDFGARLEAQLYSRRIVLLDDKTMAKVLEGHDDLKYEHGDKLVALTPKKSPFIWISRSFYEAKSMQEIDLKCDAILHELVVSEIVDNDPNAEFDKEMKERVLGLSSMLSEINDEYKDVPAATLQDLIVKLGYRRAGPTAQQKLQLEQDMYDILGKLATECALRSGGTGIGSAIEFKNSTIVQYYHLAGDYMWLSKSIGFSVQLDRDHLGNGPHDLWSKLSQEIGASLLDIKALATGDSAKPKLESGGSGLSIRNCSKIESLAKSHEFNLYEYKIRKPAAAASADGTTKGGVVIPTPGTDAK